MGTIQTEVKSRSNQIFGMGFFHADSGRESGTSVDYGDDALEVDPADECRLHPVAASSASVWNRWSVIRIDRRKDKRAVGAFQRGTLNGAKLMSLNSEKTLKGLLWWLVIFHASLGLLGLFAKETAVFLAEAFFNFELQLTPQMYWIINPFAAYLLAFAGFMAVAAIDPKRHRNVIYVGAGLLAVRVVQRAIFLINAPADLVADASKASIGLTIAIVSAITLSLILLTRRLK